MEDDERLNLNLNEIWRACRKIQATIFRYGFDICADFEEHDPNCTGLISDSLFTSILGKYKHVVGLSEFELLEVTDYFRLRDGRVAYKQFCKVVCQEPASVNKKDLATGLEWNDPMQINVIPRPEDRRRLCLILIKIAQYSNLPLFPYFQDYEIVSQNVGVVTVAHFSRVLHFLKIPLSDDDFLLLLKRYLKDSYTVNYVAFVKHIQNIMDYMKQNNLLDNAMQIIKDFPGRLVDLELSELPAINGTKMALRIFPDLCNHPKENKDVCDIIFCIQSYVHKRRVRVKEFLECFDNLHTGTITKNQFERGLDNIGVRKYLSQRDMRLLITRYLDPIDSNRIIWRSFEDEIDRVFTLKNLEKMPLVEVHSPPDYIQNMPRDGTLDWDRAEESVRNYCEEALLRIQTRIRNRRLHLHPFFRNYDKLNRGHVGCNQANQVFLTNGILLSNNELNALLERYGNELGFNYTKFLEHADPAEYAVPKLKPHPEALKTKCPAISKDAGDHFNEEYIIKLLSNIKRQAITRSINIIDFLQDYDRHREGDILEIDFRRGLSNALINLTSDEWNAIGNIFRSPKRACCVLYRDFCRALDEIFIEIETSMGDKQITAVPLIHLANLDCLECFLNFEERTLCSQALMKLARKPDEISNLRQVFQDFDREQCGTVTRNQLVRALTIREMHNMISSRELDAVYKCFGLQRGLRLEFKYREFLSMLDILFQTGQVKRNY
ncbi:uncharacterized protein LOC101452318 [Ceratitis capitata]|uniref:uncharacterized protein LOC101452318 n=1 Tax=Ceratitis capitata TaxID=7213 RepID=UPI00032A1D22|nr:uncharacterized protein LOC101452318 [Ceratitis capitata]